MTGRPELLAGRDAVLMWALISVLDPGLHPGNRGTHGRCLVTSAMTLLDPAEETDLLLCLTEMLPAEPSLLLCCCAMVPPRLPETIPPPD
jgi:hypothetical protein